MNKTQRALLSRNLAWSNVNQLMAVYGESTLFALCTGSVEIMLIKISQNFLRSLSTVFHMVCFSLACGFVCYIRRKKYQGSVKQEKVCKFNYSCVYMHKIFAHFIVI